MTTEQTELSTAICVYLKNYPGRDGRQFNEVFGDRAQQLLGRVHEILAKTVKIDLEWSGPTLTDGGPPSRQSWSSVTRALHPKRLARFAGTTPTWSDSRPSSKPT